MLANTIAIRTVVVLLLCSASAAYAAEYRITIPADDPGTALVSATFQSVDRRLYMFRGANQLPRRWATFVSDLQVADASGQRITVTEAADGAWELAAVPDGPVSLSYRVKLEHEQHAWSGGVDGAAYRRDWGVFYTARSLFVVNGDERDGIDVVFDLPPGWQVTAPWMPLPGQAAAFKVDNHDTLAGSMIFAGTHREVTIRQGPFEFLLALGGDRVLEQQGTFVDTAKGILDYYTGLMGDIPRIESLGGSGPPVVIINEYPSTDGEAIGNNISILLSPEGDAMSETIARLIFVHEFFHLWNGKSFAPTGNDAEWFKEGFSNLYTLKALRHIGFLDDEAFVGLLNNFFYRRYINDDGVGRLSMTDGDLKHDHWGLVYSGGMLVAIAQDIMIRAATDNEKSLDDLMRHMFERYGDEGYDSSDLLRVLTELSGEDQTAFFERYIFGTEEIPLGEYLALAGVETTKYNDQKVFTISEDATESQREILRGLLGRRNSTPGRTRR